MNMLKFSFSWRCASVATVSKTIDDLPEPETPVKIVILRLWMRTETFLRLFSRAPRISMYSCGALFGTFFALQIERDRRADKRLERGCVDLVAFADVDGAADISLQ